MSNLRRRRHHRVAQKEIENATMEGYFIKDEDKGRVIAGSCLILLLTFLYGLLLGHLLGRKCEEE